MEEGYKSSLLNLARQIGVYFVVSIIIWFLSDNMKIFSGVCWLFGRDLFRKYGRPIGLIESDYGGTRVEAWSSPDALSKCYSSVTP